MVHGWMDGWTDGRTDGRKEGRMGDTSITKVGDVGNTDDVIIVSGQWQE